MFNFDSTIEEFTTTTIKQNQIIMSQLEFHTKLDNMSSVLHAFAYNLTKNVEDAKDLYQETAFRAITNQDKFRPGTNFKAWLFTIMKNILINNYRKKTKANTIMDSTDNMYYINSGSITINNKAESNIMMKELIKMIEELDDSIKVPFLMHYQGFKYQEIADQLDLPLGTVKSRIFFARKELKGLIGNRYKNIALGRR
ncbi:MAG: RNA polymerase sigma factor [Saprospiraceae bacterium]